MNVARNLSKYHLGKIHQGPIIAMNEARVSIILEKIIQGPVIAVNEARISSSYQSPLKSSNLRPISFGFGPTPTIWVPTGS